MKIITKNKSNILIFVDYCTPETRCRSHKENGSEAMCASHAWLWAAVVYQQSWLELTVIYLWRVYFPEALKLKKSWFWQVASQVTSHLRCGVNKELAMLFKTSCKRFKLDLFKIMKESSEVLMSSYAVHYLCTKQM